MTRARAPDPWTAGAAVSVRACGLRGVGSGELGRQQGVGAAAELVLCSRDDETVVPAELGAVQVDVIVGSSAQVEARKAAKTTLETD